MNEELIQLLQGLAKPAWREVYRKTSPSCRNFIDLDNRFHREGTRLFMVAIYNDEQRIGRIKVYLASGYMDTPLANNIFVNDIMADVNYTDVIELAVYTWDEYLYRLNQIPVDTAEVLERVEQYHERVSHW